MERPYYADFRKNVVPSYITTAVKSISILNTAKVGTVDGGSCMDSRPATDTSGGDATLHTVSSSQGKSTMNNEENLNKSAWFDTPMASAADTAVTEGKSKCVNVGFCLCGETCII